jgi:hypothetical protein
MFAVRRQGRHVAQTSAAIAMLHVPVKKKMVLASPAPCPVSSVQASKRVDGVKLKSDLKQTCGTLSIVRDFFTL